MGTSNSYGGPGGGTPLVPTWLGGDEGIPNNNQPLDNNEPSPANGDKPLVPLKKPDDNHEAPPDRYRSARGNFTRFSKSGGTDRQSLGRAISSYVSTSSGGSKRAARRMGSSRTVTAGLIGFLSDIRQRGTEAALQTLNLGSLVGKSIEDIFLGLADYICPPGGTVDEGVSRNAFIETIADLASSGITDLDQLTFEQMQAVLEIYATHAIEARLCNDIGTKICIVPTNISNVEQVQSQLQDFIRRSVADALNSSTDELKKISPDKALVFVEHIYEQAFSILQTIAEAESSI